MDNREKQTVINEALGEFLHVMMWRRSLHQHPELSFEEHRTAKVVAEALQHEGIEYRSVAGTGVLARIEGTKACVGRERDALVLRADMDALRITEQADLAFRSENGAMHACGHDAHTAMLLGAARALKRAEASLTCRVRLIFQPSEECDVSGAQVLIDNGVLEGVDEIVAIHVENALQCGELGFCAGPFEAGCHPYTIEFIGKSAHATMPQNGCDALAMAVKAYNNIYLMKCREMDPFCQHVLSISSLQAGHVHNAIPDYAKMLISVRFYDLAVNEKIDARIKQICCNAAQELDGEVRFTDHISSYPVINTPEATEHMARAAATVLGEGNAHPLSPKMYSEDFSHYLQDVPGALVQLGTGNKAAGITAPLHSNVFCIEESALRKGSEVFVQYVLENMN